MAGVKIVIPGQVPKIIFTREAYVEMMAICRSTKIEVGWLGFVDRLPDDHQRQQFRIYKAVLPPQKLATGVTCEFIDDKLLEYITDGHKPERLMELNKLRFWGHSHHTMSTGPSSQDESDGILRVLGTKDSSDDPGWYITAIFNHAGDINLGYYEYRTGIKITDLEYHIEGVDVGGMVSEAKKIFPNIDDAALVEMCRKELISELSVEIGAKVQEMSAFVASQIDQQKTTKFSTVGNAAKRLPEDIDVKLYSSLYRYRERKEYCEKNGYSFEDVEDFINAVKDAESCSKPRPGKQSSNDSQFAELMDHYYPKDYPDEFDYPNEYDCDTFTTSVPFSRAERILNGRL